MWHTSCELKLTSKQSRYILDRLNITIPRLTFHLQGIYDLQRISLQNSIHVNMPISLLNSTAFQPAYVSGSTWSTMNCFKEHVDAKTFPSWSLTIIPIAIICLALSITTSQFTLVTYEGQPSTLELLQFILVLHYFLPFGQLY